MLQCAAVCCSVLQCVAVCCSVLHLRATGWRRIIGCLIFIGQFSRKSPRIGGYFAEIHLRLRASSESSPHCTRVQPDFKNKTKNRQESNSSTTRMHFKLPFSRFPQKSPKCPQKSLRSPRKSPTFLQERADVRFAARTHRWGWLRGGYGRTDGGG